MQSSLAPVSSDIIKACLPGGQAKPFPQNSFSLMVLTGAKGSMVNHSQVRSINHNLFFYPDSLQIWDRDLRDGLLTNAEPPLFDSPDFS